MQGEGSAKMPKKTMQIREQTDILENSTATILDQVSNLEGRLQAILLPSDCTAENDSPEPCLVPLAYKIWQVNENLARVMTRLEL
jgi:hypothetical protein